MNIFHTTATAITTTKTSNNIKTILCRFRGGKGKTQSADHEIRLIL